MALVLVYKFDMYVKGVLAIVIAVVLSIYLFIYLSIQKFDQCQKNNSSVILRRTVSRVYDTTSLLSPADFGVHACPVDEP